MRACALTINGVYASRISLCTHRIYFYILCTIKIFVTPSASSPRGMIINARPAARIRSLPLDDNADREKKNYLDSSRGRVYRCTSEQRHARYFSRLIHGPMDDRAGKGDREREREKGASPPFTSR